MIDDHAFGLSPEITHVNVDDRIVVTRGRVQTGHAMRWKQIGQPYAETWQNAERCLYNNV